MSINFAAFIASLKYLVVGMVSIFIVIGVIILVTVLLNKIFSSKNKN